MARCTHHSAGPVSSRVQEVLPPHDEAQGPADEGGPGEIVARPDGFHWIAPDGRQEFGPFSTLEALRAFRDAFDDGSPEPAETLDEAERDIGLAGWIDPETGEPAEGASPPHLEGD